MPETAEPIQWLATTEHLPQQESSAEGNTASLDLAQIRETLAELGVRLEINCSETGWQGITLHVPTDNKVIDGITVVAQDTYYVFPVQLIKRIINLDEAKRIDASASNHKELIEIDQNVVPLMRLKAEKDASALDRQIVLILSYEKTLRAVVVDELVGLQQVLVTPLEGQLANVSQYQGCAVLGKDRIGMVVSTSAIF
jgi:two-component system chemotaxis sensor kinase CheA